MISGTFLNQGVIGVSGFLVVGPELRQPGMEPRLEMTLSPIPNRCNSEILRVFLLSFLAVCKRASPAVLSRFDKRLRGETSSAVNTSPCRVACTPLGHFSRRSLS